MKCPQFVMASLHLRRDITNPNTDCLREECARWDKVGQRCADLSILEELRLLVGAISMLTDKMPPESK